MVTETNPAAVPIASVTSPELESTPPLVSVLEQRVDSMEKNVTWIRDDLNNFLRGQVYGDSRENTPAFLASPVTTAPHFQTSEHHQRAPPQKILTGSTL